MTEDGWKLVYDGFEFVTPAKLEPALGLGDADAALAGPTNGHDVEGDQPLTGRSFDGENYNIGFVNVTDTPYVEMIEAARVVHAEAYARRARE